ncbi:MAG: hypothetical protein AAF658_22060, partial [Myxococcota bacterium]
YWRAYGIALHRRLDLTGARAAYDAALALNPADDATRCYRGEVALYQDDHPTALRDLEWVVEHGRPALRARAEALLRHLENSSVKDLMREILPVRPKTPGGFTLTDSTPLPLGDGRYATPQPLTEETTITSVANQWLDATSPGTGEHPQDPIERTATAIRPNPRRSADSAPPPMPASDTWTARVARGPSRMDDEIETAQIRRRPNDGELPEPLHDGETGKIRRAPRRPAGDGDTARIQRGPRPIEEGGDTDLVTRVRVSRERFERTEPRITETTALVRRRRGQPLGFDEGVDP